MSSHSNDARVRWILGHFYVRVETLQDAVAVTGQDSNTLVQSGDKDSFVRLIKTTLVATPANAKCPPHDLADSPHTDIHDLTDSPHMDIHDLVRTLVEKLCKRDKFRNALTHGFREISHDSMSWMWRAQSVELVHPSYCMNMFYTGAWCTLLERMGNKRLMYLLENRAFFIEVNPSNYLQVIGIPVCEMWPVQNKVAKVAHPGNSVVRQKHIRNSSGVTERQKRKRRKVFTRITSVAAGDKCLTNDNTVTHDVVTHGNVTENAMTHDNIVTHNSIVINDGGRSDTDLTCHTVVTGDIMKYDRNVMDEKVTFVPMIKDQGVINDITVDNNHATDDKRMTNDINMIDVACRKVNSETCVANIMSHAVINGLTNEIVTSPKVTHDNVRCSIVTVNHDAGLTHDCLTHHNLMHTHDVSEVSQLSRKRPCDVLEEKGCDVGGDRVGGRAEERKRRQPRKRWRRRKQGKTYGNELGKAYSYHLLFDHRGIFYTHNLQAKFPGNHILSKVTADDVGVMSLVNCVFLKAEIGTVITKGPDDNPEQDLTDVYKALMPHFSLLISNHKQCRYRQLLQKFAPQQQLQQTQVAVTTGESQVGIATESETPAAVPLVSDSRPRKKVANSLAARMERKDIGTLLELNTTAGQVFLFLRAVCNRVVPLALWGSTHNKHVFLTNVNRFLKLGRFEKLTLGQLMRKTKDTECAWLDGVSSHLRRQELTAKFFYWLLNNYIIVLLKSFFYITDSTTGKNHVLYYHKTLWRVIRRKALTALLEKGMLSPIDRRTALTLLAKKASLGVSYLRFLPKATSLRSIINMSRWLSPKSNKKFSINTELKDLLYVLRFEMEEDPSLVGSSVFGVSDIYRKWKTFVLRRLGVNDSRCLYCVKVDIKACYDTVNAQLLFTLISDVLKKRKHRYTIRHYSTVTERGGKLKRTFHSNAVTEDNFEVNILVLLLHGGDISRKNIHDAIIGDKVKFYYCEPEALLLTLKAHLFGNIIASDDTYYLQTQGISQGSVLSTLLNNIYYGDLEKRHLGATQEDELLMRHTDDFLFVTPHLDRATSFLDTLLPGIPEYNCHVNPEKTLCNFKYDNIISLPFTALFPWCGLLIDPCSLEVKPDYAQCLTQSVTDSLTTELSRNPGMALRDKLLFCLKIKCHALFFDPQINSADVTRTNIYNVFLYLAAMFQCIIHKFPSNQGVQKNPLFFLGVVQQLSRFFLHRCRVLTQTGDENCVFCMTVIEWLCCKAFEQTLQCRQSAYRSLLKLLHRWHSRLEKRMDNGIKEELAKAAQNAWELTRMLD